MIDIAHPLSGFLVGALVGITGVGGGSLMAPIMILLLGVAPATAVGTDLWFAATTKSVGGVVHHRLGDPDWQVVRRLAMGSIPASIATLGLLATLDMHQMKEGLIMQALGVLLILTAMASLAWKRIGAVALSLRAETASSFKRRQPGLTVFGGAILGVMVTLTSVGAGALGATMLMALYPLRMRAMRLVGTDIVHAVPLTIVAGIGHLWLGNVDFGLLGSLLVGSIPGIIVGSLIATRVKDGVIRPILAVVIFASGVKLIF